MKVRSRILAALFAAFLVAGGLLGMTGCVMSSESEPESTTSESEQVKSFDSPTLEQFIEADTKTGDFELTTEFADGTILFQTGTLWLDGNLFRYDLYQDGELIRSVMTADGTNVYFAQHPDEVCEPAVANADHYMRKFNAPPVESVEDGTDEETGAQRVKYVVQETTNMSGSANPWYVEDVVYLVEDGSVIGIVQRGGVPKDDGSVPDLQTTRFIFSDLQAGVEIDPSVFELPYPIQESE